MLNVNTVPLPHDQLTTSSFYLYAAKHYDNPGVLDQEEFEEDLLRFKYIKRLLNKFQTKGELREKLILNHVIVLCNVFGPKAAVRMLFYQLPTSQHGLILPFLLYVQIAPEQITGIGPSNKTIRMSDIPIDQKIVAALRALK